MSAIVLVKLVAVFAVIGVGWVAGRTRVVGPDAAGILTQATFSIFTPALLFRTTAGIALARLPWTMLAAYFVPTLGLLLAMYAWQRARHEKAPVPSIRGLSITFSNTVQLGIPVVTALFGVAGLAVHIAIVSLQSLVLLTSATVLTETGLSREVRNPRHVVAQTVRRSLLHPVVTPILLGLAFNATGAPIPGPIDDVLATLGQAVVPLSLVAIGLTLQLHGVAGAVSQAVLLSLGKLFLHPAIVLAVAYAVVGLRGLPLTIAVLCAALPVGSNVLLFANRYGALQAETTAAIVASTSAFLLSGSLWLVILTLVAGPAGG